MSMHFESISKETLYIALEIINSNPEYNLLENGNSERTLQEAEKDLLNPSTESNFIKLDDTYIGLMDYLEENPNDHFPWLGLLMIHRDYQGYGFGVQAFELYIEKFLKRSERVRIGVLKENIKAHSFWKSLGFVSYKTSKSSFEKEIICYEKYLE